MHCYDQNLDEIIAMMTKSNVANPCIYILYCIMHSNNVIDENYDFVIVVAVTVAITMATSMYR